MIRKKFLLWIAFVVVGTIFYSWLSSQVGANSDNMSSLLISKDMADGNYQLNGWYMSTQSYIFSDIVWTALAIKVFGFNPILSHVMPGLFFSFTVLFSIAITRDKNKSGWIFLVPILIIPTFFTVANAIELNIHGGIYLLSVAMLFLIINSSDKIIPYTLIIMPIIVGIFADSDKLIIFTFSLPCFLAAIFHASLSSYNRRRHIYIAMAAFMSIIFFKIFGVALPKLFDYEVPGVGNPAIATPDVIFNNINIFISGVGEYFSIQLKSEGITLALSIFRLLCLLFVSILFIRALFVSWKKSFADTFLFLSTGIPVGAFIFSSIPIDITSSRFFFFSILSAIILVARNTNITLLPSIIAPVLLIWAISNLLSIINNRVTEDAYYSDLGRYLESQGLENGYAEFWRASILSATSQVHVSPVHVDGLIRPHYWLSKNEWYERNGNFFITNNKNEEQVAIAQFGDPVRGLEYNGMKILVWDSIPIPPVGFKVNTINETSLPIKVYKKTDSGMQNTGEVGFMLSGPYVRLKSGKYKIVVHGDIINGSPFIEIFSAAKGISIKKNTTNKKGVILESTFVLDKDIDDMEVRLYVNNDDNITIKGYSISKQ